MDLGLGGKAALVTGASEGIGIAVARTLAQEGVRVAICARTEATLRETATEITKATGVEVIPARWSSGPPDRICHSQTPAALGASRSNVTALL